ncbi:MAG: type III secretion system chaperone [Pseudomonadota bacterium]
MTTSETAQIERLLTRLLGGLGHGGIRVSDEGTLGLRYDDRFDLCLEVDEDTGTLHVFADLANATVPEQADFLAQLLSANVAETGEARFALDPTSDRVLYCYAHAASDLDEIGLQTILENFLADCLTWQERLREMSASGDEAAGRKPPLTSKFIRA